MLITTEQWLQQHLLSEKHRYQPQATSDPHYGQNTNKQASKQASKQVITIIVQLFYSRKYLPRASSSIPLANIENQKKKIKQRLKHNMMDNLCQGY